MNRLYPKAKKAIGLGEINLVATDIHAALVTVDYTYSMDHEFLSDLGDNVNGISERLQSVSFESGVFDAMPTEIVASKEVSCGAVVLYKQTKHSRTSRLLVYLDMSASGLPFVPKSGQRVDVTFDTGPNRIFAWKG